MAKSVTLSDISERLKISTVTVSKALSGQKGVSEELRKKIIELADEMGYKKALRNNTERNSYTIGTIVAERFLQENQSFYWKLYQEINQKAIARNSFTMLEVISYSDEKKFVLPKTVIEGKIDGLIVIGAFKLEYMNMLNEKVMVPRLNLDTTSVGDNCDFVVSNNLMGGYLMTNYLFELGHRKIGFVGTRLATTSIDDRYFGYLKSLMEHGISWSDNWIVDDRDREYGKVDYDNKFRLPFADMPSAFFCNCDLSASLLIRKLAEAGYSVPKDISVVGFDNYVIDQFGSVGITTYEIDIKEMAGKAVHMMLNKLSKSNYTAGMFVMNGKFIERDSAKQVGLTVPFV